MEIKPRYAHVQGTSASLKHILGLLVIYACRKFLWGELGDRYYRGVSILFFPLPPLFPPWLLLSLRASQIGGVHRASESHPQAAVLFFISAPDLYN